MATDNSAHIADELPQLLTGEASRDVVLAAAEHLRRCVDCTQELVSAVVSHASLTSAQRLAPELMQLPDLSAVFAQVQVEAAAAPLEHRRRIRRLGAMSLTAAAAVAAVAIGTTVLVTDHSTSSSHRVALAAYGVGHTSASAMLTDGRLRVDASGLPSLDATHRYEVWLTDAARVRMQPIGWIGSNGKADLTVPTGLADDYQAIEVSVQQIVNTDYSYSGTSVLRGTYG